MIDKSNYILCSCYKPTQSINCTIEQRKDDLTNLTKLKIGQSHIITPADLIQPKLVLSLNKLIVHSHVAPATIGQPGFW